jgi:colanic acid/amylovoran biosynthesis glycosyltransferase
MSHRAIAMVVGSFPEISQKFILNQVAGLLDEGVDLDIYAAMENPDGKQHALVSAYRMTDRARFASLPPSGKERLRRAPALLARALAADPARAVAALRPCYATASRGLKNLFFLRSFGDRRYDIVHSHFGPNGLVGAFLKDVGIARRLIVTFHGSDINSYPRKHGVRVYRTLYDRADLVTANTAFTKARIVANGCPEEKIEVLPVGLRMNELPETPFSDRSPGMVLTVGRLVEKKGHRHALEAIALLRGRVPSLQYVVAGDGPERQRLEKLASDLGIMDLVVFLGVCTDRAVQDLYRRAAVFVLPSVTASDGDMEGQGLVLQEAQAAGLPVVSTLHNGIPEGVKDGMTGFLVPERDVEALAARIGELLSDSALRRRMGAAGRSFVGSTYDTSILTKRLLELYERVI